MEFGKSKRRHKGIGALIQWGRTLIRKKRRKT